MSLVMIRINNNNNVAREANPIKSSFATIMEQFVDPGLENGNTSGACITTTTARQIETYLLSMHNKLVFGFLFCPCFASPFP